MKTHALFGALIGVLSNMTFMTVVIVTILVGLSLVCWSIIVRKTAQFRRIDRQILVSLQEIDDANGLRELIDAVKQRKGTFASRLLKRTLRFYSKLNQDSPEDGHDRRRLRPLQPIDANAMQALSERVVGEHRARLEKGLAWLQITMAVGPLMGLLGTVTGIMSVFLGIQAKGSASIAAIAPGVGEALITTAAGLIVAIPAAIAYNTLSGKLAAIVENMYFYADEILVLLVEESRPGTEERRS